MFLMDRVATGNKSSPFHSFPSGSSRTSVRLVLKFVTERGAGESAFTVFCQVSCTPVYSVHPRFGAKLSGKKYFALIVDSIFSSLTFRNKTDDQIPGYYFAHGYRYCFLELHFSCISTNKRIKNIYMGTDSVLPTYNAHPIFPSKIWAKTCALYTAKHGRQSRDGSQGARPSAVGSERTVPGRWGQWRFSRPDVSPRPQHLPLQGATIPPSPPLLGETQPPHTFPAALSSGLGSPRGATGSPHPRACAPLGFATQAHLPCQRVPSAEGFHVSPPWALQPPCEQPVGLRRRQRPREGKFTGPSLSLIHI